VYVGSFHDKPIAREEHSVLFAKDREVLLSRLMDLPKVTTNFSSSFSFFISTYCFTSTFSSSFYYSCFSLFFLSDFLSASHYKCSA
jgi:hypothetical protein